MSANFKSQQTATASRCFLAIARLSYFSFFFKFCLRLDFYLRQVNEVNGGDTVFVRFVSVCLSPVSVRSGPVDQTSLKRLKLRTSNMTCNMHVPRDSQEMTP